MSFFIKRIAETAIDITYGYYLNVKIERKIIMKEFIHPKSIELFYHNEETDELKFISIPWKNVTKFEMGNITKEIIMKKNMLIKTEIIGELEFVATKILLHEDLSFEFTLHEITIIDTNNQKQTYSVNKSPNHSYSKRNYNDFRISYY